ELPLDVLSQVAALVDKSLVHQVEQTNGEARLRMLETTREYALDQLRAAGEAETASRIHAGYYLALAQTAETCLNGPQQHVWLNRLDQEHNNLRAALRWASESRDAGSLETGLRLCAALWQFWAFRGYLDEGRTRIENMLSLTSALNETMPEARAKAL